MDEENAELIQINKPKKKSLLEKYEILIDHLSFEYISECKDTKELERIVTILRSGEEGVYPDLAKHAEDRLTILKPSSSVLRKTEPVLGRHMLEPQVRREVENDINNWRQEMKNREKDLARAKSSATCELFIHPDIRQVEEKNIKKSTYLDATTHKAKRISSCDYAAWDKFDADTEINRIDLQDERQQIKAKEVQRRQREAANRGREVPKEVIVNELSLTGTEIDVMALQEREKGNEAYRAGDYEEALQRYNASIVIDSNPITYNNRAMILIKLSRYEDAIKDCNTVLSFDYKNIKALLRRGLSLEHLEKQSEALADYESVLKLEPDNKVAIAAVNKLRKPCKSRKLRMKITEGHIDANKNCVQPITSNNNKECLNVSRPSNRFKNARSNVCFCDRAPSVSYNSNPLPHIKSEYCVDFETVQQPYHVDHNNPFKSGSNIQFKDNNDDSRIQNPKSIFSYVTKCSKSSNVVIEEIPNDTCENQNVSQTLFSQKDIEKIQTKLAHNEHTENKAKTKKTIVKDLDGRYNTKVPKSESHVTLQLKSSYPPQTEQQLCNTDYKQLIKLGEQSMESFKNFGNVKTPYEYFCIWQSIKDENNLKLHAQLFRSINPDKLDAYIGNKLDSSMLSVILRCLNEHFCTEKDMELLQRFLSALIRVERFHILSLFIDQADKKTLENMMQLLEDNNVGDVRSLRESYNIDKSV